MPGSKLGKYLLYAAGEIVLVVIGILIALGINNWNTRNRETEARQELGQEVLDIIARDLAEIDKTQEEIEQFEKFYSLVLTPPPSISRDSMLLGAQMVASGASLYDFNDQALLATQQASYARDSLSLTLRDIYRVYKSGQETLQVRKDLIADELVSHLNELRATTDWFHLWMLDGTLTPMAEEYFISIPFKNRAAQLDLLYLDTYQYELFLHEERLKKYQAQLQRHL